MSIASNAYVAATIRHRRNGSDVDPVAVELAVKRGGVRLRPAELCAAIRSLTERVNAETGREWSAREIAQHLGTSSRNVPRHRRCTDASHRAVRP